MGSVRRCLGRGLCSANDVQSARGSLHTYLKVHVEGTFKLGTWVGRQRQIKTKCPLNAGSGWMQSDLFGIAREAWERGFAALTTFKAREGHCRCPSRSYRRQLSSLGSGSVYSARKEIPCPLTVGSDWMKSDLFGIRSKVAWEEGFAALTTFKAREGHCRVPDSHIEGTFKLGIGSVDNAANRDTMPAERRQRLDAIGFIWEPLEEAWEEGFAALTDIQGARGSLSRPSKSY